MEAAEGRAAPRAPLGGGGRWPPPLWAGVWGWAGSKHTNTLSLAKASFGAGSVPDPALLALDPAVWGLGPPVLISVDKRRWLIEI